MGTSLRSMDEVLSGNGNTAVMIAQVVAALLVSYFVNQKMKQEVHLVRAPACLHDIDTDMRTLGM